MTVSTYFTPIDRNTNGDFTIYRDASNFENCIASIQKLLQNMAQAPKRDLIKASQLIDDMIEKNMELSPLTNPLSYYFDKHMSTSPLTIEKSVLNLREEAFSGQACIVRENLIHFLDEKKESLLLILASFGVAYLNYQTAPMTFAVSFWIGITARLTTLLVEKVFYEYFPKPTALLNLEIQSAVALASYGYASYNSVAIPLAGAHFGYVFLGRAYEVAGRTFAFAINCLFPEDEKSSQKAFLA